MTPTPKLRSSAVSFFHSVRGPRSAGPRLKDHSLNEHPKKKTAQKSKSLSVTVKSTLLTGFESYCPLQNFHISYPKFVYKFKIKM